MIIQTLRCPICGAEPELAIVASSEYERYVGGANPRSAFPNMAPDTVERMDHGICSDCRERRMTEY